MYNRYFLTCKANSRRFVHSPQDHFIITLIFSGRRDWRDTQGKLPLARNPDNSWWHRHTSLKLFGRSTWIHGQQVCFCFHYHDVIGLHSLFLLLLLNLSTRMCPAQHMLGVKHQLWTQLCDYKSLKINQSNSKSYSLQNHVFVFRWFALIKY